ncbi:MAG: tetratricopeptide repeat protein [Verrucomicrobiota bacterium]|nr:tetratricopeptide repeat protein [Verrucomicrobiota bacterium]
MRETVESDPTSASARRNRWAACFRTGRQLALTGEASGALDNYTKATELMEGLATADPADKGHRRWLALTYLSLGELFAKLDQPNRALEIYRKAIAISEQVFAPDPDRAEVQRDLARMHEAMGLLFANTDQPAPALEYFKKAEAMAQASANHDPQNARVRIRLARIWTEMAGFHRKLADGRDSPVASRDANLKTALDLYRRSLEIWQELRDKGMLSRIDASKPDEVTREITNCESRTSAR